VPLPPPLPLPPAEPPAPLPPPPAPPPALPLPLGWELPEDGIVPGLDIELAPGRAVPVAPCDVADVPLPPVVMRDAGSLWVGVAVEGLPCAKAIPVPARNPTKATEAKRRMILVLTDIAV
jgi:hypothetical protein